MHDMFKVKKMKRVAIALNSIPFNPKDSKLQNLKIM